MPLLFTDLQKTIKLDVGDWRELVGGFTGHSFTLQGATCRLGPFSPYRLLQDLELSLRGGQRTSPIWVNLELHFQRSSL